MSPLEGPAAPPPHGRLAAVPFWYLRHGETDWNARGLSQGNVDIPLNATGIAQAEKAAEALRGKTIATIICSPLGRARITADYAARALNLPVAIDEGLREVAFGVQEGAPMAEWFNDWVEGAFTPEGAETFMGLRDRAAAAVNRCLALPGPVLIVGHGAFFRALRAEMGLVPNVRLPNATPMWCEPGDPAWSLTM